MGFVEYVEPSAFDDADMSRVIATRDHDDRLLLANTESGTLTLAVDDVGLSYAIDLADSPLAQDVAASVQRRDLPPANGSVPDEELVLARRKLEPAGPCGGRQPR